MDTLWLLRPALMEGRIPSASVIIVIMWRFWRAITCLYQMPLVKHRQLLLSADVPRCRHRFERRQGFRHGPPLF